MKDVDTRTLKGGMVFELSLGFTKRLLTTKQQEDGHIVILEALAEKITFEIATGRNGRIWVKGANVQETILIGDALQRTDSETLNVGEQKKLVRKLLKEH